MTRRFLNGETHMSKPHVPPAEYIGMRREPGELKHLSSRRKRKKTSIPGVAASETGRAQTRVRASGGSDCIIDSQILTERSWKDRPQRVKAP